MTGVPSSHDFEAVVLRCKTTWCCLKWRRLRCIQQLCCFESREPWRYGGSLFLQRHPEAVAVVDGAAWLAACFASIHRFLVGDAQFKCHVISNYKWLMERVTTAFLNESEDSPFSFSSSSGGAEVDVWIPELVLALSCLASEKPRGRGRARQACKG